MDMQIPFPEPQVERAPFPLQAHPGYNRVFRRGALTVGLILPLETHAASPHPSMADHVQMAQRAEQAGVAALWARDIPFYDPQYGDSGQIFEPLIYIGHLATATQKITLGTTGIVLPLREPLMLAKQVNSLDRLTGGRIVIGMSSGDRPAEYPVFGIDFDSRGERFRQAYEVYRSVSDKDFPRFDSPRFGHGDGSLTMLPRPLFGSVPTLAVGRSQQALGWIANNMDGYLGFVPEPAKLQSFVDEWKATNRQTRDGESAEDDAKPLAFGGFLYLHPRRDYPFRRIGGGFAIGSRALRDYLDEARERGVSHVALNPRVTPRDYREILDELHEDVLAHFPPNA
ncbi:TIGR03571 family LLM class oxidoreductase [Paraburkholderia phymatum]|uniref:Luciferase family protein n=1 Tax=Paraburkholderia phymatum (strain DSM 17167 / CIP 108236 / LMG 21445 / STM815) TaxID=391038 RepID=B2JU42_PARP8|nr:TIGR03571 family LLM class oxidoreductase [Paraburkholderia phymatum]ACC76095.1 luciferase family protein [Paraburkholderia phymatum STM815]